MGFAPQASSDPQDFLWILVPLKLTRALKADFCFEGNLLDPAKHLSLLLFSIFPRVEFCMTSLIQAVSAQRVSKTIIESTPRSDSMGNGLTEHAVQSIEGQVRTMKGALERSVQER